MRRFLRARLQRGWVDGLGGALTVLFLGLGLLVTSAVVLPAWGVMRLAAPRRPHG